ncbi:MAG: hypothetical protein LBP59_06130 [Planctomycetaceae bacterium]|jgi:hypothetical protein|nr:hypothetical protein [Planctomycetaceae bacterium]
MANAKQKHNWDLIAPLICGIYNQFASKRTRINIADVHPFLKKTQKVIPFNSVMWDELLKQLRK